MSKSKGTALILSALPGIGVFGFDKLYVGATGLFVAQLVCSILIIGLLFSGPYAFISSLTLVLTILFGINTFLYPKVNWAPTTRNDKTIAWVIVGIYILFLVVAIVSPLAGRSRETFAFEPEAERPHTLTWHDVDDE